MMWSASQNPLSQAPELFINHFSSVLEDANPPLIPIINKNNEDATGTFRQIK
jgi:hypothetical protein